MTGRSAFFYLLGILLLTALVAGWYIVSFSARKLDNRSFNSVNAFADVQTQVAFGPRTPGSPGHALLRDWVRSELKSAGWQVDFHESEKLGHPIYNIIARRSPDAPQIILAAHYDTRFHADHDPDPAKQMLPVPGANDGASGVAVLLELARSLPADTLPVWLVFFDAEDNGQIEGWDWILGSRAFTDEIPVQPQAVVIVDMIGDSDLNIYYEKNSDGILRSEIWDTAAQLGYGDHFISKEKYSILDDHIPFLEQGIPAVDIIDFDYPYWHTTQDTPDKVTSQSLQAVGDTLWHWVVGKGETQQ